MERHSFKYTHWKSYQNDQSKDKFNSEGIFKRNGKWVVRVENKTGSKHMRPFISLAQFDTKKEAVERYNQYKSVA